MWRKFNLFWSTIRYLKLKQICYQLYYRFRKLILGSPQLRTEISSLITREPAISFSIPPLQSYLGNLTFSFLNIKHQFIQIDWNYPNYGKLWTYNLNYFDYLLQPGISEDTGRSLIQDFLSNTSNIKIGVEPYPTSIRIVNWIKFISRYHIQEDSINSSLFDQIRLLDNNLEYHLLGNHLLENAFALIWGAWYFKDTKRFHKAKKIISQELNEQILPDGAHFELSPMYHQLILLKLLDTTQLLKSDPNTDAVFIHTLEYKAGMMLNWLGQIKNQNGSLPNFNDATPGVAPSVKDLFRYGKHLDIPISNNPLHASGYRKLICNEWELTIDIGNIGPDYIPGHAHSDTLSFELHVEQVPFIVDLGISTYEKNERRQWERSTAAHNTVQIENIEQSAIWGGFRVGRRAKPLAIREQSNQIEAAHDGYKKWNIYPSRKWTISKSGIEIDDVINGNGYKTATARFYIHPSHRLAINANLVESPIASLSFEGAHSIQIKPYDFPLGYNQLQAGQLIEVSFHGNLHTWISR